MTWGFPQGGADPDQAGADHVYVRTRFDLPYAIAGVITLLPPLTYEFMASVDLTGDRIVCEGPIVIKGQSTDTCILSSTGLTGAALLTGTGAIVLRDITLKAEQAIDLDGGSVADLIWYRVDFIDCATEIGTLTDYRNVLFRDTKLTGGGPLNFVGGLATCGLDGILLMPAAGKVGINLPVGFSVSRRFRLSQCAVVSLTGSTGIAAAPANFPLNETLILTDVSFSGPGTYLSGISALDNAALFTRCVGIANSADVSQYIMSGNVTATTLTTAGTYYKIAGITVDGEVVSKFVNTDNRATYVGSLEASFQISVVMSLSGKGNNEHGVRIAKNGVALASSESLVTVPTGGRTENLTIQELVSLKAGDYLEVWLTNNDTSAETATVSDMNVIVKTL